MPNTSANKRKKKKRIRPQIPIDANQRYEIPEANQYLRQSSAKTYGDIKNGKIKVIRDGGRTYIPGCEIIRLSSVSA